jgi:DNA-binding transcriptional LysR family regulator
MEMRQVRYFLALSRTLNFTRAADICDVSRPALIRAIQTLEEEFGQQLVRRNGDCAHPTELGRQMLPSLQRCYDSAVAATATAKDQMKINGSRRSLALAPGNELA